MRLHSCIAGFVYRCVSNDPTVWIHPRVNPRLEGLSDGTKAHGLSRKPVAVLVRGRGEDGVTLPFTKTILISNTCLCLPPSSLASPWQHRALFPVAKETLRPLVHHCGNTCYKSPKHQLILSQSGCYWIPQVPPPVLVQVLAWTLPSPALFSQLSVFGFKSWNQSAVPIKQLTLKAFCFCSVEWGISLSRSNKCGWTLRN